MVKSEMEKLYEEYLRSDDTVRIQDGKRYYRALTVDELTFRGLKNVISTLSYGRRILWQSKKNKPLTTHS